MIKKITKIFIILFILLIFKIEDSNSLYGSFATSDNNTYSSSCWIAPSVPILQYPTNPTYANASSSWAQNPYMDWQDSITTCPLPTTIQYQYETYSDSALTHLVYRSDWLDNSYIPAPGTPEGSYYWRVRARDNWGNVSNFSDPWLLVVDNTSPSQPVFYLEEDTNSVKIDWLAVTDAAGYKIYRSTDNITYTEIANIGLVTTYTDTGLASNNDYYYKVTAYDLAGNESNPATINGKYAGTMDIVIDDDAMNSDFSSSGTVSKAGSWTAYHMNNVPSVLQNAVGGDNWGTGYYPSGQTFSWQTNTPINGYYEIYAQYICDPARNVASYEIFANATSLGTANLDQRLLSDQTTACPPQSSASEAGPQWAKIGRFSFENQIAKVVLNAGSNPGYILADAIGFKKIEDTIKPTSIITTGLNILGTNINNPESDNTAIGYHNHTINLFGWDGRIDGIASDNIGGSGVKRVVLSIQRIRLLPYFNGYWDGTNWISGSSEETTRVTATGTISWTYQLTSHPTGTYIIKSHAIDNANNIEDTYTLILVNEEEIQQELITATPTPTPANQSPQLELKFSEDNKKILFSINNINNYQKLSYELTYKSFNTDRGVIGNDIEINNQSSYSKEVDLATCSSGVCTYDENISNIKLKVILKDDQEKETIIDKTLK